jgi:uncharacterized protein (DUF2141 family)
MFVTLLMAAQVATAQPSASLNIVIDQLRPAKGYVMVGLYASRQDYDNERRLLSGRITVTSGQAEHILRGLAPGEYAIKMFHDIDGDGTLDTNVLGIPSEPAAFSNTAKGVMGPPSWDKARFRVTAPTTTQTIHFHAR